MPRRNCSIADDLVLLPWWVSVVLALIAYVLLPGILPQPMVKTGIVGLVTIGLLALAAISALRAWRKRSVLEKQTSIVVE